jgi:basic membrane protein A
MIKRGDVAVFDTIVAVAEGRFSAGLRSFGLAEDGVGYVSEGPHAAGIAEDIKAQVAALRARVIAGSIKIPTK